ncbi:MAG: ABC transporter permease [Tepidisphaeraceae bacterium]
MLFQMVIKVAFRSLLANKLRSALSVLGVIVGVAAVIAMLAIVNGFHRWAMQRIKSFGANQLVIVPGGRGSGGVISGTQQNLTVPDALALCDLANVQDVSPVSEGDFQAKYLNRNAVADVSGVAPTFLLIANYQIDHGVMFSDDDVDRTAHVAVLTPRMAEQLFGKSDPIGKFFKIGSLSFRAVGLVKNRGGFEGDNEIFVPYTTAMHALLGRPSLNYVFVEAEDGSDLIAVEHDLVETLRNRHKILPGAPDDVHVFNQARFIETVNQWSKTAAILLGSVATLSLLVGGVGIMNIMLASVTERTHEIGVRKAVGARDFDILCQFLIEAVIISCGGGVSGVGLGIGTAWLVEHLTVFHTAVQLSSVLLALGFAAAVGIFFGFYPARRASRLDPIDALRYE